MPGRQKKTGTPPLNSSDNIRIAKSDGKVKLYGKFNHKWYATELGESLKITNQHHPSADSIIAFKNSNEIRLIPNITASMDGKLKFRNQAKDAGITLFQDSGTLKVRNINNTADAVLKAKRLQVDTGTSGTDLATLGEIFYTSTGDTFQAIGKNLVVNAFLGGSIGDSATFSLVSHSSDSLNLTNGIFLAKFLM